MTGRCGVYGGGEPGGVGGVEMIAGDRGRLTGRLLWKKIRSLPGGMVGVRQFAVFEEKDWRAGGAAGNGWS